MEQVDQAVVEGKLTCFECLYDLRGQPTDGRCPECGATVVMALRPDRWDRADATWRRRVRRGLLWASGEYLAVLAIIATTLVTRYDRPWMGTAMFGTMGACSVIGAWLMTGREPGTGTGHARWWRGAVRGLGVWVALGYVMVAAMLILPYSIRSLVGWRFEQWVLIIMSLLNGPKLAVQLSGIARLLGRVPGRPLCRVAWVWALTPLVGWGALGLGCITNTTKYQMMVSIGVLIAFAATTAYELVLWWTLRSGRART